MGDSLKNALKAALKKAGSFLSPKQKKNKLTDANKVTGDRAQSESDDVNFAEVMKREGVKPSKFAHMKVGQETNISASELGAQKSSADSQDRITKKDVVLRHVPPSKPKQHKQVKAATILPKFEKTHQLINSNKPKEKKNIPVPPKAPTKSNYTISVNNPVSPNLELVKITRSWNQIDLPNNGADEQIDVAHDDKREVVIGLDFGTASVKVVIGDSALGKAFAVPFSDEIGLASYLLPSRVWLGDEGYSLGASNSENPLRDLKLQLIDNSCSPESFSHAAVFLALVIRHSRGWLFSEKAASYQRVKILWKLTLGLPAESYNNKALVERFMKLAAAAWRLSLAKESIIHGKIVADICGIALQMKLQDFQSLPELKHIEFDVVPELSAQIYGFLTSTRFDPQAKNIFMMVDVGAGTIDSSVFRVRRGRGNKYDFNYYSNFVEFNGVANLHAERIKWLRSAFQSKGVPQDIITMLDKMEIPADLLKCIPEKINDYFDGIEISFDDIEASPDAVFFTKRVKHQVTGKTLKKARECVRYEREFADTPLFLCGGGSRMKYYKRLEEELRSHPNATWFRFKSQKLEVPEILLANGVSKDDFDRLSVAFGLSFLQVGKVVREIEPPPPPPPIRQVCPGCGAVGTCYCD